jgi:hypothetical protein
MKKPFLVLCLAISVACAGQAAKKPSQSSASQTAAKPLPIATLVEVSASDKSSWSLAFAFSTRDEKDKPKSGDDAATDFGAYVAEKPESDWGPMIVAEHTLVVRDQTVLSRFLRQITKPLLYSMIPVRFASKDNGLVLVEASVGSDNVYNTLRLETKERAAKEIVATILPAIKQFRGINVPDVKSFGVVAIYGTKDFSAPDSIPEPEVVALVASVENCRKLDEAEITEEDFVASSDIYLVDKDSADARKVKISLDAH